MIRPAHYAHPERQAIFVGDLVDRGGEQLRVLEIVKRMVDAGSAQIVMGNHEFNAICYATEYPAGSGQYLRKHTEKNDNQHRAFLEQLTDEQRDPLPRVVQDDAAVARPRRHSCRARMLARGVDEIR